jgi:heme/copper-type cytochrome/quinol oxidase subunit 4
MATDTGIVIYYRSIQTQKTLAAMILSFALTIIPLFIAARGITTRRPSVFLLYAIGAAIGTAIGMAIKL